ncbi:SDR family oxidoreductase [Gammaproteobacteria bacterium]|nr:SDR family oxidoreductase [Gammaproteobacteria bacterium]
MDLNLAGKKVLVTGSSRGIGLQIANGFIIEGCSVVCNSRSHFIPEGSSNSDAHFVSGDVSTEIGAKKVIDEAASILDGLDIVICNVGSGKSVPPGQETQESWTTSFEINFYSTIHTIQAARPFLKASRGVIICISSICGTEIIPGAPVTYSVSKAALNAYVKGISRPFGEEGIRICAVAPGNIFFDGSVWDEKLKTNSTAVNQMLKDEVPLNKLGSSDDVANLVLFLSSPVADNITGSILVSDGGQTKSL